MRVIRERWAIEGAETDLGLWWLADDVREVLGTSATEDEVRRATLDAVRPLMAAGTLRAADRLESGEFRIWGESLEQQLAKIESEWIAVGEPDIGDVVWFIGDVSPHERH